MHLSSIPQYTIENINVHISALSGAPWDMGDVHWGIYEIGLFKFDGILQWRHNERDELALVYLTVKAGADQRKHQSSASLAFMQIYVLHTKAFVK